MREDSGLILLGLKNDHGSTTATLHLSVLGECRAPARPGWGHPLPWAQGTTWAEDRVGCWVENGAECWLCSQKTTAS